MAELFATLIKRDRKSFSDVPDILKEEIREILIADGREDLVTE